jgi:hypothetical protein
VRSPRLHRPERTTLHPQIRAATRFRTRLRLRSLLVRRPRTVRGRRRRRSAGIPSRLRPRPQAPLIRAAWQTLGRVEARRTRCRRTGVGLAPTTSRRTFSEGGSARRDWRDAR